MKVVSKKFGIETKEQAEELIDAMMNNAAEQIAVVSVIASENDVGMEEIVTKFSCLVDQKKAEYLKEMLKPLTDLIEKNPEILDDLGTEESD